MGLVTEWIHYGKEGRYSGYAARPDGVKEPLPSVIILQEIWGVDEHIQDVTRRFAQAGYIAFAPDLFAEDGSRPDELSAKRIQAAKEFLNAIPQKSWRSLEDRQAALSVLPEHERSPVAETLDALFNLGGKIAGYIEQSRVTAEFLRDNYEYSIGQGVASVGFCLGGALSASLAAKDKELRGAVIYYGNPPAAESIVDIHAPLLGFYGELDKRITDAIPQFGDALTAAGKSFEYHIYPDAPHAFFNDTRPSFHVRSARDSFIRALVFLQQVLQPDISVTQLDRLLIERE